MNGTQTALTPGITVQHFPAQILNSNTPGLISFDWRTAGASCFTRGITTTLLLPPPFLTLAIRQCGALLQQQLGHTALPVPDTPCPTIPLGPPRARRYTSTRALPGGVQLGLSRSALSPEALGGLHPENYSPRHMYSGIWGAASHPGVAGHFGSEPYLRLVGPRRTFHAGHLGAPASNHRCQSSVH